ncbi:MAG TPA: DUF4124 domain-containing protein [Xanthomonadales bacterium]|nr:DUF4124 domain-containing protein [Xanthomonadales bacterium]
MKCISFRRSTVYALLIAFLLTAPAVGAEVYKWTDENGVTHYTQTPPPEGRDASIEDIPAEPEKAGIGMPVNANLNGADDSSDQPSAADLQRQEIADNRAENAAEQYEIAAVCNEARSRLARLEPNRRVYYENEEGETVRMDDQQRVDEVAALKLIIQSNCS